MKECTKPKVGEEFYLVRYASKTTNDYYSAIVSKVGIKYFTVTYKSNYSGRTTYYDVEFVIKTRRVKTEYTTPYSLWQSKIEYDDTMLTNKLFEELKSSLTEYSIPKWVTLDKLKAIHTIINEEVDYELPEN
jgi:hypothetical protein